LKNFMLETINLVKTFGGLVALNHLNFGIRHGQIKSIIGPNGAGKTTLFNLICGIQPPSGGKIILGVENLIGLRPHDIARKGISRTFQNLRLFCDMSVLENIMVGCQCGAKPKFLSSAFKLPSSTKREKLMEKDSMGILSFLGIESFSKEQASNIPFGYQKMIEIGRALATKPRLLLLDEPASGLNDHERNQLSLLISKMRESGLTILLVEHNMDLVMKVSDEILVLNYGSKIAEGTPSEIQNNQDVIDAYLGEDFKYA
jgi:branched-chain amino acid transport system ATP-binding protein